MNSGFSVELASDWSQRCAPWPGVRGQALAAGLAFLVWRIEVKLSG
jgi:hypothetical protein